MTNGHHMNKSESPFPKDDLGQVWLKSTQCYRSRVLFILKKILVYFYTFAIISPWEMTNDHHMNKSESPYPNDDLGQVRVKLAQYFLS